MASQPYRVETHESPLADDLQSDAQAEHPSMRVPGAPYRPGDEPRFAKFTQQPGDCDRPAYTARYTDLHEHALGLVRVLDDEGYAHGAWDPQLAPEVLKAGLRQMIRIREYDTRMLKLQRQGRLSFYLESRGEEAVAIAAGMALADDDLLFPSYRQQGLMLVRGVSLLDMACQCIGNSRDNTKGRQMPVHYSSREHHVVSISSPVGTQCPQAVGAALASAMRGERRVTATWMGEGTTAQGDFHYALNFASVYRPPVVINIVNNQWAISTHRNLSTGGRTFAMRGEAYGIPGLRVDGNDFLAVYAVTAWAAERARKGEGPTLIELLTYRGGAHSSSDDPSRYRPADEARLWPGGDPVQRLSQHLVNLGLWSHEQTARLQAEAAEEVVAAYREAETYGTLANPQQSLDAMFEDVYETLPPHLEWQRDLARQAQRDTQQPAESGDEQ